VNHADHVALIRAGVSSGGVTSGGAPAGIVPTWADIGAGTGAFTLALADLLGAGARIVAVDRDAAALRENARRLAAHGAAVTLESVVADVAGPLDLPDLDGLVAANVLHFIEPGRRVALVAALAGHLRPGRPFVVVEYETSRATPWLPYPLPFDEFERVAAAAGLLDARRTGSNPGTSAGGMYAGIARAPG
jgi:SAM-dependent methyltransferase